MTVTNTFETRSDADQSFAETVPAARRLPLSTKIQSRHLDRLAVVYVRQSSLQQVIDHRESRERQYALSEHAQGLGWSSDRILVVDEDQGQSGKTADRRIGFQRILTEVTMDHVGIVLSLEMSRLARSSKDWHHLLEVCALFGALLGDQDGIYDPNDSNDRLLLGLKGTMSEVELFTMRNRLDRGRMFKAERGELFNHVPFGYVKLPNGDVVMETDEQARAVVQLLFDKFDELGTIHGLFRYLIQHGIRLGFRQRTGPQRGQLVWHKPSIAQLLQTFRHPMYAGAYVYGRRMVDQKYRAVHGGRTGQRWRPMSEWRVLIRDRLPAYITWDHFLANNDRIRNNRPGIDSPGVIRPGSALLAGILYCGICGHRLQAQYHRANSPYYVCADEYRAGSSNVCCGMTASAIDELVSRQVLLALQPASIDLSLQAAQGVRTERERLQKHWQRQLERARIEATRAERQYQAVEPENRLVARTLEKNWEDALKRLRNLEEEHDRFLNSLPAAPTEAEQQRIERLAVDIPALWHADTTTATDRKEIIRCLIERVVAHIPKDHEFVDVTICWRGGSTSQHQIIRRIVTYELHRDYGSMMERIVALRLAGFDTPSIAKQLDAEGFRPSKRANGFSVSIVRQLLLRSGIGDDRNHPDALGPDEWWTADLARKLEMDRKKLRYWIGEGWLHSRKTLVQGLRVLWADADEIRRLCQLRDISAPGKKNYPKELTTPKRKG
ncbi:MAG: recombinase family protein [Planctomycetota bacterium]|nr:recombinase family protein [Planctomycetota bacterium]